jgi:hypothetical protein
MSAEPSFPLLTLYALHVPNIDTFWSTLFTQLAYKISPPGLNISGQTLFSMKASVVSATPGNTGGSNGTDIHVGSASIVSTSITQQKLSVQRGHAKLSTLLMTTRGQLSLNKPRKGRLVSGSVAISESGLARTSSEESNESKHNMSESDVNKNNILEMFPLKCSVSAQQFSVSLPTTLITSDHVQKDPVLLQLVIDSFMMMKRLITMYTFLSSDSDVSNQSSQLMQRTEVMRSKISQINRWCDLKSKMVKEELLGQYCLQMKDKHNLTWPATSGLRTMIELALAGREHKSSDIQMLNGVVVGITDIEYDERLHRFVNRRWSKAKSADHDLVSPSDTESQNGDGDGEEEGEGEEEDDEHVSKENTLNTGSTSLTAIKLMSKLEPSPLIAPYHTLGLQRTPTTAPRLVAWDRREKQRLQTHHDIGRHLPHSEKIDLIHAYERIVISYNR